MECIYITTLDIEYHIYFMHKVNRYQCILYQKNAAEPIYIPQKNLLCKTKWWKLNENNR